MHKIICFLTRLHPLPGVPVLPAGLEQTGMGGFVPVAPTLLSLAAPKAIEQGGFFQNGPNAFGLLDPSPVFYFTFSHLCQISKAKALWQGSLCLDPYVKVVVMRSWRMCPWNCFCSAIIIRSTCYQCWRHMWYCQDKAAATLGCPVLPESEPKWGFAFRKLERSQTPSVLCHLKNILLLCQVFRP